MEITANEVGRGVTRRLITTDNHLTPPPSLVNELLRSQRHASGRSARLYSRRAIQRSPMGAAVGGGERTQHAFDDAYLRTAE